MFVYLTWKNNGKELKTMIDYAKATIFTEKLSKLGLKPQVIFESTCAPKALAKIKA
tara:strand:- start:312 stop:479 length:168 start_codon:yes stop_codon:yes gene_type:complete